MSVLHYTSDTKMDKRESEKNTKSINMSWTEEGEDKAKSKQPKTEKIN